jgi:hypothetical protein
VHQIAILHPYLPPLTRTAHTTIVHQCSCRAYVVTTVSSSTGVIQQLRTQFNLEYDPISQHLRLTFFTTTRAERNRAAFHHPLDHHHAHFHISIPFFKPKYMAADYFRLIIEVQLRRKLSKLLGPFTSHRNVPLGVALRHWQSQNTVATKWSIAPDIRERPCVSLRRYNVVVPGLPISLFLTFAVQASSTFA